MAKAPLKAPSTSLTSRIKGWSRRRKIMTGVGVALSLLVLFFAFGLLGASGQILKPKFKGVTNFAACAPETEAFFGKGCGNLRDTKQFAFIEVSIPSDNDYEVPGWLIKTADNGRGQAEGAIMLVHPGGADRRAMTKLVDFYLSQKLDVLTFDYSCQGEAPCKTTGITYGEREAADVTGAYKYLTKQYDKVYAMGSSVGAAAVLIALPDMSGLDGAIAENPMANFKRLLKETPEAQAMPGWFTDALANLAMKRGGFDGDKSAEKAVAATNNTPLLFIHSREDKVIAYKQSEDLAAIYDGTKTLWIADKGEHAGIWDANSETYEQKVAAFLQNKR
jgi:alpha-beta hydrolase superfamily lysophospholipase